MYISGPAEDEHVKRVQAMIIEHTQRVTSGIHKMGGGGCGIDMALNQEQNDIDVSGIVSSLSEILKKRMIEIDKEQY